MAAIGDVDDAGEVGKVQGGVAARGCCDGKCALVGKGGWQGDVVELCKGDELFCCVRGDVRERAAFARSCCISFNSIRGIVKLATLGLLIASINCCARLLDCAVTAVLHQHMWSTSTTLHPRDCCIGKTFQYLLQGKLLSYATMATATTATDVSDGCCANV